MPTPFPDLPTVYATDEAIAVRAAGDYVDLCPEWQKLAAGTDGVITSGSPWVLSCASNDFLAQGVTTHHVVALTGPSSAFRGTGELFAVESVTAKTGSPAASTMTLRRIGQQVGVGMPLPPVALTNGTGATFKVKTFGPDIQTASYEIQQRYGIDSTRYYRGPQWIYDLQVLEQVTILTLLVRLYGASNRAKEGDWALKYSVYRAELDEKLAMCSVRWGPYGNSGPPVGKTSCRLAR